MKQNGKIFLFNIGNLRIGLDLGVVQRIEGAVEITRIPDMPASITGIVDYHGSIIPVYDLRQRLGLPVKDVHPSWKFIIVDSGKHRMILVADEVEGILDVEFSDIIPGPALDKGMEQPSFLRLEDGIVYVFDIDRFLSAEEEIKLDSALKRITRQENEI
jgi:purine-binding chemotaxis protein CheW